MNVDPKSEFSKIIFANRHQIAPWNFIEKFFKAVFNLKVYDVKALFGFQITNCNVEKILLVYPQI